MWNAIVEFVTRQLRRFPRPLQWLRDLLGGGDQRVHAVVILMIAATLCLCTLALVSVLVIAVCQRWTDPKLPLPNLIAELGLFVTGITTLGGYIYNRGKTSEDAKGNPS